MLLLLFLFKEANTPKENVSCHTPPADVRMTTQMPEFTLWIGDLVRVEKNTPALWHPKITAGTF